MTSFTAAATLTNDPAQARYATAWSKTTGETWANGAGLYYESTDASLRFWVGKYNVAWSQMPIAAGEKAHVACTWDGTTARLYKNGAQVATSKPLEVATTGTLQWGGAPGGYAWKGAIANQAWQDRALSAQEVADLYAVTQAPPPPPPPPPVVDTRPKILSPDSQWRRTLGSVSGTDVFYDGQSNDIGAYLAQTVAKERAAGRGPWVATYNSTAYLWIADANTPRRKVNVRTDLAASLRKPLQQVLNAVPIDDAWFTTYNPPDQGEDSMLCVYDKDADEYYELFWFRRKSGPGASGTLPGGDPDWLEAPYYNAADPNAYGSCHWGGVTKNASKSFGTFGYDSYPPWSRPSWGGTAGSHLFAAGLVTMAELQEGRIDHALAADMGRMRAGIVSLPALRSDGLNLDQFGVSYGMHFRIVPEVDLNAINFATPLAKMFADAMQRKGIIFRNQTGGATTIFCEDPTPAGMRGQFWDQQTGAPAPNGFFKGMQPPQALDGIPWDRMMLLETFNMQTPGTRTAVRGDLADSAKAQLLERQVGKTWGTKYLGLYTTAPRHDTPNVPGVEVVGGGYSRIPITPAEWGNAVVTGTNVSISNKVAKAFPNPTGTWGTPEAVGLFDEQAGGPPGPFGWIPPSKRAPVGVGHPLVIPIDGFWLEDLAVSVYIDSSVG